MANSDFVTVPEELLAVASLALNHFQANGFKVAIEKSDIELPATPTLILTRNPQRSFVLVRNKIVDAEIDLWLRYCKSCTKDVRLVLCMPRDTKLDQDILMRLKGFGIGLYVEIVHAGTIQPILSRLIDSRDLAFNAKLPEIASLKPKVRTLLSAALDEFDQGEWREGFRQACIVLEEQCRLYLKRSIKMNRAQFQPKGTQKILSPTVKQVNKMTLGQMKDVICGLIKQNKVEANLCKALEKLNPLRIKITHKPGSGATERKLRESTGSSMWIIINSLTDMV